MDGVTLSLSLDMVGSSTKTSIRAKQCDTNSRFLLLSLMANGEPWQLPFDCQAYLYAQKPDKTKVFSPCTKDGWNSILAPLTEQMLAVPGDIDCELYIATEDGDVKSQIFTLTVDEMLFDKNVIESTDEFNALREKLIELQNAIKVSEDTTKKADAATVKAGIAAEEALNAAGSIQDAVNAADAAKVSAKEAKDAKDHVVLLADNFDGYGKLATDRKYANAIIGKATGTGSIPVTDAYPAPVLDLSVYGESRQDTTKGNQLLDFDVWKTSVEGSGGVIKGTAAFEGNKITLAATGDDCYTIYEGSSSAFLKIPVKASTKYTFSWEYEGAEGKCFLFRNGSSTSCLDVLNSNKKLSITTHEDTTFITFRVGVAKAEGTFPTGI